MFENYSEMDDAGKAFVKAAHLSLRAGVEGHPQSGTVSGSRCGNLAWAFVRGMPYRRVERTTRTQTMPDGSVVMHNVPDARYVTFLVAVAVPGFADVDLRRPHLAKAHPDVVAWLKNQDGAVPAPATRPRQ